MSQTSDCYHFCKTFIVLLCASTYFCAPPSLPLTAVLPTIPVSEILISPPQLVDAGPLPGPLLEPFKDQKHHGSLIEWIEAIFLPTTTTTTTSTTPLPIGPMRECRDCSCGTINTYKRIVGGMETEVHEYPWMAMLRYNKQFLCGGALVNDLYVVTAAHCVRGFVPFLFQVRLLEYNLKNSSMDVIDRDQAGIFIHEKYDPRTLDNDIAIIRLAQPVEFTNVLRPVCLPMNQDNFAGQTAVVTGWGALKEGGSSADVLQELEVPVLTQDDCHNSKYGPDQITDNMLCAGFIEGGKDSCQGDSGGPLHMYINDVEKQYQLGGIVSWGHGCARPGYPGVYTRVTQYMDWIAQRTRDGCSCQPPSKIN